jgi:hypothetical protein
MIDLDLVFLSYDEPRAEEFYQNLCAISPRTPLRVHGVTGFDAAHKQAAAIARTSHLIIVDGDNLLRREFFDWSLPGDCPSDVVFSYTAHNAINGLAYGNGGVKVWLRELLLSVDTHERADGNDFCWTFRYWQMPEIASDVHCAQSPYQAFRAGYREAVKLSLVQNELLDWPTTRATMYPPNFSRLLVWAMVGTDVEFGQWAIYGARCGLAHVWLEQREPNLIRDYRWFAERWTQCASDDPIERSIILGRRLESRLGVDLPMLTPTDSRWFKQVFRDEPRQGLMLPDLPPP